ncbi:MAG: hypothetical protein IAG10_04835, partial [Planctomycetaceae bacterium]|nr:hypothetical protein [Planctomycetaceae bacterium]
MLFTRWLKGLAGRILTTRKLRSRSRRGMARLFSRATSPVSWLASPMGGVPTSDLAEIVERLEDRSLLVAGTFNFAAASSNPMENAGAHLVTVQLTTDAGLGAGDTMSVDVSVGAGSATGGGTDYTFAMTTVTFTDADVAAAGTFSKTVSVTLINDNFVEGDETVRLDLSNQQRSDAGDTVALGAPNQHTVTIDDNDTVAVAFTAATSGTTEMGAPTANVAVGLTFTTDGTGTAQLERSVLVNVTRTGGTATDGTDHNAIGTQTLTFAAGSTAATTQNATIMVTNDQRVEGNETVILGVALNTDNTGGQASIGG